MVLTAFSKFPHFMLKDADDHDFKSTQMCWQFCPLFSPTLTPKQLKMVLETDI